MTAPVPIATTAIKFQASMSQARDRRHNGASVSVECSVTGLCCAIELDYPFGLWLRCVGRKD